MGFSPILLSFVTCVRAFVFRSFSMIAYTNLSFVSLEPPLIRVRSGSLYLPPRRVLYSITPSIFLSKLMLFNKDKCTERTFSFSTLPCKHLLTFSIETMKTTISQSLIKIDWDTFHAHFVHLILCIEI